MLKNAFDLSHSTWEPNHDEYGSSRWGAWGDFSCRIFPCLGLYCILEYCLHVPWDNKCQIPLWQGKQQPKTSPSGKQWRHVELLKRKKSEGGNSIVLSQEICPQFPLSPDNCDIRRNLKYHKTSESSLGPSWVCYPEQGTDAEGWSMKSSEPCGFSQSFGNWRMCSDHQHASQCHLPSVVCHSSPVGRLPSVNLK